MKPVIGITCGWSEKEGRHYLSDYYVRAVLGSGGLPFLLPTTDPGEAEAIFSNLDGLIFSGGEDLDPFYFGQEPIQGLGEITPLRDHFELALGALALTGEIPVLAICRGAQVLNVAAGGTLHQDLIPLSNLLHCQKAPKWYPTHEVTVAKNSKLYAIVQEERFRVNSFHHQANSEMGTGLAVAAWSQDQLVEGIEGIDTRHSIIGIQWHPECTWERDQISRRLFLNLVEEAKVRKAGS